MKSSVHILLDFLYEMAVYQYPKSALVMFISFIIYFITNMEVLDCGWALCHLAVALGLTLQYYDQVNLRGWISLGIVTLWSIRLCLFIFVYKALPGKEDPRYQKFTKNIKYKSLFYFPQYTFLGIITTINCTPLYFVFRSYEGQEAGGLYRWNFYVSMAICSVALIGHTYADQELQSYRVKRDRKIKKIEDGKTKIENQAGQDLN